MKKGILLLIVLIPVISCKQVKQTGQTAEEYHAEVKEKIAQINNLYFEAWENKDLDSTLNFLDDGFINMYSFGSTQTKEECREGFKSIFDAYSIEDVEYRSEECIVDENYAFVTGVLKQKWIANDEQDTVLQVARGISVFRKQEDGGWKMFRLVAQQ